MTDLSHVIRKFNRFELKYILSLKQAWEFRSALQDYLVPADLGGLKDLRGRNWRKGPLPREISLMRSR